MDIMEEYKKLVIDQGFRVGINTKYCNIHKESHANCEGCECHDGCHRYVLLAMVNSKAMLFTPTTYDDFKEQQKDTTDAMKMILDKDVTTEELDEKLM